MFDLFTFLVSAVWLDCFAVAKFLASCPVVAPFETNDLSLVEASESVDKVHVVPYSVSPTGSKQSLCPRRTETLRLLTSNSSNKVYLPGNALPDIEVQTLE